MRLIVLALRFPPFTEPLNFKNPFSTHNSNSVRSPRLPPLPPLAAAAMCHACDFSSPETNRFYLFFMAAMLVMMGVIQITCGGWVADHETLARTFWEARVLCIAVSFLGVVGLLSGLLVALATKNKHKGCLMSFSLVLVALFVSQVTIGTVMLSLTENDMLQTLADKELKNAYISLVTEVNEEGPLRVDALATLTSISTKGLCCGFDSLHSHSHQLANGVNCDGYTKVCRAEFLATVGATLRPWGVGIIVFSCIQLAMLVLACILVVRVRAMPSKKDQTNPGVGKRHAV